MEAKKTPHECRKRVTRFIDDPHPPRHLRRVVFEKVIHVLQLRKGTLLHSVQAGLVLTLVAMLSACSEQPVPANSELAQVAATAGSEHDQGDMPVVTITASREVPKNEG